MRYTVHKYASDEKPCTIEVNHDECPFCIAGYQLIKWEDAGDVVYLAIDNHIHHVECVNLNPLVLYCNHITKEDADREIIAHTNNQA